MFSILPMDISECRPEGLLNPKTWPLDEIQNGSIDLTSLKKTLPPLELKLAVKRKEHTKSHTDMLSQTHKHGDTLCMHSVPFSTLWAFPIMQMSVMNNVTRWVAFHGQLPSVIIWRLSVRWCLTFQQSVSLAYTLKLVCWGPMCKKKQL